MLTVYKPEVKDLWFRKKMMADEETMSYNRAWGGTIPFPEERWKEWYDHWIIDHHGQRYYRYVRDEDNAFVGEIAYHYDDGLSGYMADVIIFSGYRGRGYGARALSLLCSAAKENGIRVLYDEIAADNPALKLFAEEGFTEEYRTKETVVLKKDL